MRKAVFTMSGFRAKQHYVGTDELVSKNTGAVIPAAMYVAECSDYDFHKLFLEEFLKSIEQLNNKRSQLAYWLLRNIDKNNCIEMSQQEIAEKSGISQRTVERTMHILQNNDPPFLIRRGFGSYRVNPDLIWKGSYQRRMAVVTMFTNELAEIHKMQECAQKAETPEVNTNE